MPDALHLSEFEIYVATGYGFWAGLWAVPNYIMLGNTDLASVRKWALLAAGVYALWWIFWWPQIWNGTWQWYVVVLYVPIRLYQLGAHLCYGLRGAKA